MLRCSRASRPFAAALFLCLSASSFAQQHNFATWTSNTTLTLNSATATVATGNEINATNNLLSSTGPQDGATNFPGTWFTPTPPVGTVWSIGSVDNAAAGSTGALDVTVTFDTPVANPRFHFVNLDNATVDFGGTGISRLSGNLEFEVAGNIVNATPAPAANTGCEDDAGGNPNGACGSVELSGTFTSITLTVTDTDTTVGSGDGFAWTVSAAAGPVLPPAQAVPALSNWAFYLTLILLMFAGQLAYHQQKRHQ